MWEWLLCFRRIVVQALTPIRVRHGCGCLEPLEYLRQLPLKHLEFSDLLPDSMQLLRHECLQAGTHLQTRPAVKFRRQCFEIGEGRVPVKLGALCPRRAGSGVMNLSKVNSTGC
jgi:hypothetical protein